MKGTCSVKTIRPRKRKSKQRTRRVRIGAPDPTVTGLAGLVAVDELTARLGLVAELDSGIGPIKERARGLTGGQLLVGMAAAQLAGQDHLVGMDRVRADPVSTLLGEVPLAPSRTAGRLAGRFDPDRLAGIEAGLARVYERWLALAPAPVRGPLVVRHPTIDLDASDIEVHGRTKQGVGWNYAGVRCARVHLASWAHAQLPLAMDLIPGNDDVRPHAVDLLTRALAVLPEAVCGRPRVRADAGYFDAALANGADSLGCDFAIAAKRNSAAWRAYTGIPEADWRDARNMTGAQVSACDYAPAGWPEGTYTLVRRVRIEVTDLSDDPRSRRRRTVHKDQLALACDGDVDHVWSVSFIVTNIPADDKDLAGIEAWFRDRTAIEERFREAKHGAGLNHLPSADRSVNAVWAWAGLLAGAMAVMLQTLTGLDTHADSPGRMRIATLRHLLLKIPARITSHAREHLLRLQPGQHLLAAVLARLRALPAPT
ncbi:MAG: hypothetical protein QG597_4662 [Actinomycetota bacterium]|nr:hypothetical protein [Actinomycetota bacterium]